MFRSLVSLLCGLIIIIPVCNGQEADNSISIYFKHNSSTVNAQDIILLTQWLSVNKPSAQLLIKGFTDTTGSTTYNRKLSLARAQTVAKIIKNVSSNDLLTVQGLGEDTLPNRSLLWQNRKVVVQTAPNTNSVELPKVANADSVSSRITRRIKNAERLTNKALENIFFVPDKPVLEEVSLYYLKDLASALLLYSPNTTFEIIGHVHCLGNRCNDPGLKKINDELSTARAKEVYLFLVDMGIAINRMSYRGVGSQNLQYPNPSNEGEARKNMRVEIVVHQ